MQKIQLIKKCFDKHEKEKKFTFKEYRDYWLMLNDKPNKVFKMRNRDGSEVDVRIVYYPLPYYEDLRVCIQIEKASGGLDFREVPVYFLKNN